ncbi:MAG: hypothetical protein GWP06_00760 [Actinobacteria bacterium]|nr:hypothetical protein [Actinomycetota bacterium]
MQKYISTIMLVLLFAVVNAFTKTNIDKDGMLLIDGQRTFIIGSYHLPKSEKPYRELAETGFNLLHVGASEDAFNRAQKAGLKVWYSVGTLDLKNVDKSKKDLAEKVNQFKSQPALLFRESVDEPAWTWKKAEARVSPQPFAQAYKFIKSIDPDHLLYMNHAPVNLVSTLQKYNAGTDIVACDIYPVIPHGIRPMFALFDDGMQGDLSNCTISQVGEYTDKMRRVAGKNKPVFMVLQGFSWEMLRKAGERDSSKILYPTFQQSRFMAYDAIIHGANGILYWGMSHTPQPSEFWTNLKRIVRELADLQNVLVARTEPLRVKKTYHETGHSIDAGVEIIAKKADNSVYLLSANADKNPVKITLSGLTGFSRVDVLNENRNVPIRSGGFTDSFEPFAVHVYKLLK